MIIDGIKRGHIKDRSVIIDGTSIFIGTVDAMQQDIVFIPAYSRSLLETGC